MATSKEDASTKVRVPQLVKIDRAFKLAEQWVNNMSKFEDNSAEMKIEARPPRLGVGAAVPRESIVVHSRDPVERKLRAKLDNDKKNAVKKADEAVLSVKHGITHQESDNDESESKTQSFSKKRPPLSASCLLSNKKKHK